MEQGNILSAATMLVNLRISVWGARKKDKETEAEVRKDKNAVSTKAASVHKHLLADAEPLLAIQRFSGDCRQWLYLHTAAWGDNGDRMLPTSTFFSFKQEANERENHFWQLVHAFEQQYPTLITGMALQLGSLFKRSEYPDPATIVEKFGFALSYSPVPEAGDFRLDLPNDAMSELRRSYENESARRVQAAMREAWDRLHDVIKHMQDKLEPQEDGKPKRLYDTMLGHAGDLCAVLTHLNITKDPALEEARRDLERIVERTTTDTLREVPETRASVRKQLADICDKFAL